VDALFRCKINHSDSYLQEQVRRWKVAEEKLEAEEKTAPRKRKTGKEVFSFFFLFKMKVP